MAANPIYTIGVAIGLITQSLHCIMIAINYISSSLYSVVITMNNVARTLNSISVTVYGVASSLYSFAVHVESRPRCINNTTHFLYIICVCYIKEGMRSDMITAADACSLWNAYARVPFQIWISMQKLIFF